MKTGSTQIYVVAYVNEVKVAAVTIKVYVSDDWIVDLSNNKVIYTGEKYLFSARLLLDDSSLEKRVKR